MPVALMEILLLTENTKGCSQRSGGFLPFLNLHLQLCHSPLPGILWMGATSATQYEGPAIPGEILSQQPDALICVLRALGEDHVLTSYQQKQYLWERMDKVLPADRYSQPDNSVIVLTRTQVCTHKAHTTFLLHEFPGGKCLQQ